ncbi:hypothetical protein JCM6882_006338 [Rhodosporidiobolus microsporus]
MSSSAPSRPSRPIRACNQCRKRKVKCSGAEGEALEDGQGGLATVPCVLCQVAETECVFERRLPKGPTPKSYVKSLEDRLVALEGLLASMSESNAAAGTTVSGESSARTSSDNSTPDLIAHSRPSSPQPTSLDEIQSLSERLDSLSIKTGRYLGRSSGHQVAASLNEHLGGAADPTPDGLSAVEILLNAERFSKEVPVERPPPDLERRLFDACFEQLEPWPFVVRAEFEEGVRRGRIEADAGFRSLYFAVLALGSRFVADPRLNLPASHLARLAATPSVGYTVDDAQLHLARGFQYFWASAMACGCPVLAASLPTLQGALVLSLWLLNSTSVVTTWTSVGLLIRSAIDVGAHLESAPQWNPSPLQDEQRKRVFHGALMLDRHLSFLLGRPLAIHDADVDVGVPLSISDDALIKWEQAVQAARTLGLAPPQPPAASTAHNAQMFAWPLICELHQILAEAYELLHGLKQRKSAEETSEGVRRLDSRLNEWLHGLPDVLKWQPSQLSDKDLLLSAHLHGAYYQLQILIHREFLSSSDFRTFGFPSLSICSNAARSTARLLEVLEQRGGLECPWALAPITAVTSSLMLILAAFAASPVPPPPPSYYNPPPTTSASRPRATLTPSALRDLQRCLSALASVRDSNFLARQIYGGISQFAAVIFGEQGAKRKSTCGEGGTADSSASSRADSPVCGPATTTGGGGGSGFAAPAPGGLTRPAPSAQADDARWDRDRPTPAKLRRTTNLPFSTHDLSLSTFNGRPTFSSTASAAPSSFPPDSLSSFFNPLSSSLPAQPAPAAPAPPPETPFPFPSFTSASPSTSSFPPSSSSAFASDPSFPPFDSLLGDTASLFGFDFDLSSLSSFDYSFPSVGADAAVSPEQVFAPSHPAATFVQSQPQPQPDPYGAARSHTSSFASTASSCSASFVPPSAAYAFS